VTGAYTSGLSFSKSLCAANYSLTMTVSFYLAYLVLEFVLNFENGIKIVEMGMGKRIRYPQFACAE